MSHVTQLRDLLTGEGPTFSKTPPSPLNLKRGSTFPPKSSPPQERAPTGKPDVLYSQTSARPKGLLVEFYATELRLFDAQSCDYLSAESAAPHWAII